jgi:hypothetical protein
MLSAGVVLFPPFEPIIKYSRNLVCVLYDIRDYPNLVVLNLVRSAITTLHTCELVRWERH